MKQLKKIRLVNLAKEELDNRELSKLVGGATCCICGCRDTDTLSNASANNANGKYSPGGGYGNGSFGYQG